MSDVHLKYINSVHIKVCADPSTIMELSDQLTFYADNYKWFLSTKQGCGMERFVF